MKRLRDLWPQLIAFDNLWRAWRQARRGKSRSAGAVNRHSHAGTWDEKNSVRPSVSILEVKR
ncbi:MAG: hypothetical protein F9K25_17475 [Candidatus Contendobacter sp.]|nr:MAG: hypothetical protein F9K25_17475 [Candidatus Contendobacter sp.]